jgi:protein-lysine N-methyltransferase EEF2KMT
MDELVNTWSDLITLPKPSQIQQAQQLGYIKYTAPVPPELSHGHNNEHGHEPRTVITSESRGLILSSGTTGFRTWEAALHLGTYLSSSAAESLVKGKRVLELGAGTGFISLFCAKYLGATRVMATDREPALIESIRDCVDKNQVEGVLVPGIWEWGNELAVPHGDNEGFDIALGADLVCSIHSYPTVFATC